VRPLDSESEKLQVGLEAEQKDSRALAGNDCFQKVWSLKGGHQFLCVTAP
jgi:hypothetical protein